MGCGVIVGVRVGVAGMLVKVGLDIGVADAGDAVGEGCTLQAEAIKMPNRSNDNTSRRVRMIDSSLSKAV